MEHSPKYEKVKDYYDNGFWTAQMVRNAAGRWITAAEVDEILGEVP